MTGKHGAVGQGEGTTKMVRQDKVERAFGLFPPGISWCVNPHGDGRHDGDQDEVRRVARFVEILLSEKNGCGKARRCPAQQGARMVAGMSVIRCGSRSRSIGVTCKFTKFERWDAVLRRLNSPGTKRPLVGISNWPESVLSRAAGHERSHFILMVR